MGLITDIDNLVLAIQIKQSKYKYNFVIETTFNRKTKTLVKRFCIIKHHLEKRLNEDLGKNKVVRIEDDVVKGSLVDILRYMVDELKGFD